MPGSAIYPRLFGSVDGLIAALEMRDTHTRAHCDRSVRLATELGNTCGIVDSELDALRVSARFHDIGKIGVPDAILLKPGRLNSEEWTVMQSHSESSERIIQAAALPDHEVIADVIRHHHESFYGSGYPDGLAGGNIPLLSRILLIVDAYDAMSAMRPYHPARSHKDIMAILNSESSRKFDPEVFHTFSRLIEHSPARVH